jgi:oligopeptide/dipeptide ABC transporter ATP-binding protein
VLGRQALSGVRASGASDRSEVVTLEVDDLTKVFQRRGSVSVTAVDHVSLRVGTGESLGLVGESGSGKTTLARCILRLVEPDSGSVVFKGMDVTTLAADELRRHRRHMQMVFQDPYDSLNPRWTVHTTLEEPLRLHTRLDAAQRRKRVAELLELVRLDARFADRRPHELSGGQQQRVGIARALATQPELLMLDEPTSALDSVARVQILDLLNRLRKELGLTYVFISHDLALVRAVCDRVAVMYLGQLVEAGPSAEVYAAPIHPYTRALLSGVLELFPGEAKRRYRLRDETVPAVSSFTGCRLHERCPDEDPGCVRTRPVMKEVIAGHFVACHAGPDEEEHADRRRWASLPLDHRT